MMLILPIKLLSANFEGIIFTIFIYYTLYFASIKDITLTFTDKRVLSISKYRYPRIIKIVAYFIIGWIVVVIVKQIDHSIIDTGNLGLIFIEYLLTFFNVLPVFYHQYTIFYFSNQSLLRTLDFIFTISVNYWMAFQFWKIKYRFTEVNLSQISDQLISMIRQSKMKRILSLHIIDILLIIFVFKRVTIMYIILIVVIHLRYKKSDLSQIRFFGHSGRKVLPTIVTDDSNYHKIVRITGVLFNWGSYTSRKKFPLNIIPQEVASHYDTGLRASLITALNQGNLVGAIVASIINITVIINLFIFAFRINTDTLSTVVGISLGVMATMITTWVLLNQLNKIQYKLQKEENLKIGNSYIGRWIEPNLWIIKGDKLEGKRNRDTRLKYLFSYERVTGINIAWVAITFIVIFLIFSLIMIFWILVGALNVSRLIFILPFLFDLGLNFLSIKANAELGFFLVSSFFVWIIIYYIYPKLYSASRPKMIFDLEHQLTLKIILKDEDDNNDAMNQFLKCIVASSRPSRRKSTGRPGYFIINIDLIGYWIDNTENIIYFTFGENNIRSNMISIERENTSIDDINLINNLRVSAEYGYPLIPLSVFENTDGEFKETLSINVELDTSHNIIKILTTDNNLSLTLQFRIVKAFN